VTHTSSALPATHMAAAVELPSPRRLWHAPAAFRVRALLAFAACTISESKVEGAKRTRKQTPGSTDSYPYANLIPPTLSFCYGRLVADSSCCLDQEFAPGVTRRIIRRPDTRWRCGEACYDSQKGVRGHDVIWAPDAATCTTPRLLWLHGGSWEYGSPDSSSYPQLGSKLAGLTRAVVMMPDYPLIPSGTYPTIQDAALEALRWLASEELALEMGWGKSECSEQAPLFIGGDSSGGGTAMSLALRLKKEGGWSPSGIAISMPDALPGGQLLAGVVLFSPWTNLRCDTPDYYYNAFAKIVDTNAFKNRTSGTAYVGDLMFRGHPEQNLDDFTANAEAYVANRTSMLQDPIASPFFAGEEELGGGGIPPLYIVVGGSESIQGDSLIVAQKAAAFGAHVHLDINVGMWHDFPMYSEGCGSGIPLWQAQRALNRTADFIQQMAAHKREAIRLGLIWPPAGSVAGTPHTSYIYDLSPKESEAWYPRKLINLPFHLAAGGTSAAPLPDDVQAHWRISTTGLACMLCCAACVGAFGALALKGIVVALAGHVAHTRQHLLATKGECTESLLSS